MIETVLTVLTVLGVIALVVVGLGVLAALITSAWSH